MAPAGREFGDDAQAATGLGQASRAVRPRRGPAACSVVDDRNAGRGTAPPDQDLEPATLAGAGVLDRVAGQFGHAKHRVVGGRAPVQGPGHEPPGLPDLVRMAGEDPPPWASHQPRTLPGELGQGPGRGRRGHQGLQNWLVARWWHQLGFRYLHTGR